MMEMKRVNPSSQGFVSTNIACMRQGTALSEKAIGAFRNSTILQQSLDKRVAVRMKCDERTNAMERLGTGMLRVASPAAATAARPHSSHPSQRTHLNIVHVSFS
jgi:hypothetical protein